MYCFSTAKMVEPTRVNVTSYLYCLSCFNLLFKITLQLDMTNEVKRASLNNQRICKIYIGFIETGLISKKNTADGSVHDKGSVKTEQQDTILISFNPLNPELNPICYLLALLGAHHFLHVSRIRVKLLTFRLLMSYTYGAPILDVSRSHTTTQHSR